MVRLAHNVAFITGAAGGGLLVAAAGPGWAFAGDAVLYLAGAVLLARVRLPARQRLTGTGVFGDLRAGWREFVSRRGCGASSSRSPS